MKSSEAIGTQKFTDKMEGLVHPVILNCKIQDQEYSYFGLGTAFLLNYKGYLFAVTAQHVLNNQYASHDDLRIRLRNAPVSITFDRHSVFQDQSNPDPDTDFAIFRVKKSQHGMLFAAGCKSLDATNRAETPEFGDVDFFHVWGYPDEGREYDYQEKLLTAELWYMGGKLTESALPGLSTIKIESHRPSMLRGMSGSMVIADIGGKWKFAGLAILASDSQGLLSFIPSERILYFLEKMLWTEKVGLVLPADVHEINE